MTPQRLQTRRRYPFWNPCKNPFMGLDMFKKFRPFRSYSPPSDQSRLASRPSRMVQELLHRINPFSARWAASDNHTLTALSD